MIQFVDGTSSWLVWFGSVRFVDSQACFVAFRFFLDERKDERQGKEKNEKGEGKKGSFWRGGLNCKKKNGAQTVFLGFNGFAGCFLLDG